MKTKYLLITLVMLISFTIVAQEPKKKETKPNKIESVTLKKWRNDTNNIFLSLIENTEYPEDRTCNSPEEFKLAKDFLKKHILEGLVVPREEKNHMSFSSFEPPNFDKLESKYGNEDFETIKDRIGYALNNNNTFINFVSAATGKNIGDLTPPDLRIFKEIYNEGLYASFSIRLKHAYLYASLNENCTINAKPYFDTSYKNKDYPNTTSEFKISVKIECKCDEKGEIKLEESNYEYVASVSGIESGKNYRYNEPINPKINIIDVKCCPEKEKEEENKTALNDTNDDKGYFQIGAHVGLPLGEEKDFYSLVFGADVSYLFNVTDNFSAGPKIGYTHFTGKDVGGFKVEGVGFIPVGGIIKYSFSNKISIDGNFGYTFSTEENIDGGINYEVGVGWEIAPGIVIRPEISLINLGDSGNFNSFGIGFLYAFWRK